MAHAWLDFFRKIQAAIYESKNPSGGHLRKIMIRMGRSSKTETSNGATEYQEKPANSVSSYPYTNSNQPSSTRAISESESMARDIKEGRLSGYVGNGTVLTGETNFQSMLLWHSRCHPFAHTRKRARCLGRDLLPRSCQCGQYSEVLRQTSS